MEKDNREEKCNIATAPCARIIHNAGAKYVSEKAAQILAKHLEEYAEIISNIAVQLARHANRSTVKERDFNLVFEKFKKFASK